MQDHREVLFGTCVLFVVELLVGRALLCDSLDHLLQLHLVRVVMIKMLVGQELGDHTAADVNLGVVDDHKDVDVKMVLILIKHKCKFPQVSIIRLCVT